MKNILYVDIHSQSNKYYMLTFPTILLLCKLAPIGHMTWEIVTWEESLCVRLRVFNIITPLCPTIWNHCPLLFSSFHYCQMQQWLHSLWHNHHIECHHITHSCNIVPLKFLTRIRTALLKNHKRNPWIPKNSGWSRCWNSKSLLVCAFPIALLTRTSKVQCNIPYLI